MHINEFEVIRKVKYCKTFNRYLAENASIDIHTLAVLMPYIVLHQSAMKQCKEIMEKKNFTKTFAS